MNTNLASHVTHPRRCFQRWLPGLLIAVFGGFLLLALARYWDSYGYGLVLFHAFMRYSAVGRFGCASCSRIGICSTKSIKRSRT